MHLHPGLLGLDVGQAEGVERLLVLGGDVVVLRLVVPEVLKSTGVLISSKMSTLLFASHSYTSTHLNKGIQSVPTVISEWQYKDVQLN